MSKEFDVAERFENADAKTLQDLFDRVSMITELQATMIDDIARGKREILSSDLADFMLYIATTFQQFLIALATAHRQLGKNTVVRIKKYNEIATSAAEEQEDLPAGDIKSKFN